MAFTVQDDGIGFTAGQLPFLRDVGHHEEGVQGRRGRGGLVWLKAFEKAEIDSQYIEAGRQWRRRFDFACTHTASKATTSRKPPRPRDGRPYGLSGSPDHEKCRPRTAWTIARRIVEHCLEYFATDAGPRIVLNDPDDEARNLKRFYADRCGSGPRPGSSRSRTGSLANQVLVNSGADGHIASFSASTTGRPLGGPE